MRIDSITRGTRQIVERAIIKTNNYNRDVICAAICDELYDKFDGDSLEYQLKRMKLSTTDAVNRAIDIYMQRHFEFNRIKKTYTARYSEEEDLRAMNMLKTLKNIDVIAITGMSKNHVCDLRRIQKQNKLKEAI